MKHLTFEEMTDFVSAKTADENTIRLAGKVNAHILRCAACREKVSAFREVYEGMARLKCSKNVSSAVREKTDGESLINKTE